MDKLNRRVIYLSDEEWALAKRLAGKRTVSSVLRHGLSLVGALPIEPRAVVSVSHPAPSERRVASVTADGFGHSVAAPKPGAKK